MEELLRKVLWRLEHWRAPRDNLMSRQPLGRMNPARFNPTRRGLATILNKGHKVPNYLLQ